MALEILEIELAGQIDFEEIRRWVAQNTRGGDGLVIEQGRLFVLFPRVSPTELEHAMKRLEPQLQKLGASLRICPLGQDDVVDSVHRRAEAQILPVKPRQEIV